LAKQLVVLRPLVDQVTVAIDDKDDVFPSAFPTPQLSGLARRAKTIGIAVGISP
jgi:hypothetical protein